MLKVELQFNFGIWISNLQYLVWDLFGQDDLVVIKLIDVGNKAIP